MKVLFVSPYLGTSYGGTSKVVLELAQSLAKLDLSVDVISSNANDGEVLDVQLQTWLTQDNYRLKYFPSWHRSDLVFSSKLLLWLNRHVKEYDIVHTHTLFSPLISLTHALCRFHRVPYVMTPHGMLDPWALSYKAWKKRFYYQRLEQPFLNRASVIQTLSTSEAEQVAKLGYAHSIMIPNGIHKYKFEQLPDAELFHQKFPHLRNQRLVLFLGRIDPKKGLDLLAPAFARVNAAFPDTRLVIAGPDSIGFMPVAQSYFAKADCLDAVTFTGMLSGSVKYAALAAADLYVSPSYSEGFSMSVLEGMAAGLPCIITENCNFPEARTAKAAYVVKTNADCIGDALLECLHNSDKAKQIANVSQKFIFENYTWKKVAQKLFNFYQQIVTQEGEVTKASISI
ncbi:MAG: glycosyltransferase [Leptolyngbyaceae cyanobacterium]